MGGDTITAVVDVTRTITIIRGIEVEIPTVKDGRKMTYAEVVEAAQAAAVKDFNETHPIPERHTDNAGCVELDEPYSEVDPT